MGVGPGRGSLKLSYLPEANTDFVFAVVGEEFGLMGTLGIILIWSALFLTGMQVLAPACRHAKVAGAALLSQLVLQAAVNVAVVTAVVPPKGIAHPLLSYGGSNLIVSLATIGIVLSMSRELEEATKPSAAVASSRPPERNPDDDGPRDGMIEETNEARDAVSLATGEAGCTE